jgi:hypothetical protein
MIFSGVDGGDVGGRYTYLTTLSFDMDAASVFKDF